MSRFFKSVFGTVLGRLLLVAAIVGGFTFVNAQTVSKAVNPNGVTAPSYNFYALTLQSPLPVTSGGTGTVSPYNRLTLATGVVTWTFSSAFANKPVCVANEESTTGHYLKITAISVSAVTFTSDVTTSNTDPIDAICLPAPT